MALIFPASPNHGDKFTSGNRTWVYNSTKNGWGQKHLNHAGNHDAGGADPLTPASIGAATSAQGDLAATSVQPTATQTLANKTLTNPTINAYTEGVVAIGDSGASKTLDITAGTFQTVTLTANCTFTMPTATAGKSFILKILTGAGGFTATFTSVKWSGDAAPVITPAASKYDLASFVADGTAWSGSVSQNYTP